MQDHDLYFNKIESITKLPNPTGCSLLQILQSIFHDITIFNNEKIRALISSNAKGFVPILKIIQLPIFMDYIGKNPEILVSVDEIIKCVNTESKKLIASNYQIRRLIPFVDNIKNKKLTMIYIENIPSKQNMEEVYTLIESIVGTVYKMYYKSFQRWAFLLIDNYQPLQPVKDLLSIQNKKLVIKTPQQSLFCYGEKQRMDTDYCCIRLYYNKNLFESTKKNQNQLIDHQHYSQDSDEDNDQLQQPTRQKMKKQILINGKNSSSKHNRQQHHHRKLQHQQDKRRQLTINKIFTFDNSLLVRGVRN